jgi:uncharacterized phage protein (TIGR01671 family)
MRPLKFRARINEKGRAKHLAEWQYFTLEEAFFHHGLWECIDPGTIGQFTGLHDRHGKEIWEGDKLNCTRMTDDNIYCWDEDETTGEAIGRYEVEWDEKIASFLIPDDLDNWEVIGNIFEGGE